MCAAFTIATIWIWTDRRQVGHIINTKRCTNPNIYDPCFESNNLLCADLELCDGCGRKNMAMLHNWFSIPFHPEAKNDQTVIVIDAECIEAEAVQICIIENNKECDNLSFIGRSQSNMRLQLYGCFVLFLRASSSSSSYTARRYTLIYS